MIEKWISRRLVYFECQIAQPAVSVNLQRHRVTRFEVVQHPSQLHHLFAPSPPALDFPLFDSGFLVVIEFWNCTCLLSSQRSPHE